LDPAGKGPESQRLKTMDFCATMGVIFASKGKVISRYSHVFSGWHDDVSKTAVPSLKNTSGGT